MAVSQRVPRLPKHHVTLSIRGALETARSASVISHEEHVDSSGALHVPFESELTALPWFIPSDETRVFVWYLTPKHYEYSLES